MANDFSQEDVTSWLRCHNPEKLESLWQMADQERARRVGDCVHLRGLVEISNHCVRSCHYCGISTANMTLDRYRMQHNEILDCARQAVAFGYGTLVLQAGEDPGLDAQGVADLIRALKSTTPLAITLSLGERTPAELELWRTAGADRYLLRFETSDRELFARIHPPRNNQTACDRITLLRIIQSLGYETGSGIMVGIPGQTYDSIARDVLLFRDLDLDMIGVGPYLSHPASPMARATSTDAGAQQVPATEQMACIVVALTRLMCPEANIPSTTALATINSTQGRTHGLTRGANVCMPCLTPAQYRCLYEIYPEKAGSKITPEGSHRDVLKTLADLNRPPGRGPGNRCRM
jgi:biotin synthase